MNASSTLLGTPSHVAYLEFTSKRHKQTSAGDPWAGPVQSSATAPASTTPRTTAADCAGLHQGFSPHPGGREYQLRSSAANGAGGAKNKKKPGSSRAALSGAQ